MDDQLEEYSLERGQLGIPEDDFYNATEGEEQAFVEEIVGKDEAVKGPAKPVVLPPVSSPQDAGWPVYNYTTSGGKTLAVKHDTWGTMWHCEFVPGGELPKELAGRFTTDTDAKEAAVIYLAKQD